MGNLVSNLTPAQITVSMAILLALWRPRQAQFLGKMLIFWTWFFVVCGYAVARGLLYRSDAANLNYHGARAFKLMTPLLGIRHTVEGEKHLNHQPCVYAMNHQSTMDVLSLGHFLPKNTGIIAKKELSWVPLFGWYLALGRNVLVDRGNHEHAIKAMEKAGRELSENKVTHHHHPHTHLFSGGSWRDQDTASFHLGLWEHLLLSDF